MRSIVLVAAFVMFVISSSAHAAPAAVGKPAPDFTLKDLDGKDVKLSSFKGKTVVLEWFNPGCPYVKKSHSVGSLVSTAAKHTKSGVVWLATAPDVPASDAAAACDVIGRVEQIQEVEDLTLDTALRVDAAKSLAATAAAADTRYGQLSEALTQAHKAVTALNLDRINEGVAEARDVCAGL